MSLTCYLNIKEEWVITERFNYNEYYLVLGVTRQISGYDRDLPASRASIPKNWVAA